MYNALLIAAVCCLLYVLYKLRQAIIQLRKWPKDFKLHCEKWDFYSKEYDRYFGLLMQAAKENDKDNVIFFNMRMQESLNKMEYHLKAQQPKP